jgi:hypothetical protein
VKVIQPALVREIRRVTDSGRDPVAMNPKPVIQSQYRAALAMLRAAIDACPDDLWTAAAPAPQNAFWHAAYHAVFYTHLYLHPREEDFRPWVGHRPESNFLGAVPWPPHDQPKPCDPYTRAEVLSYLDHLAGDVDPLVDALDLEGASGFHWLPFTKLEIQVYNIRHVQQHAGELSERLAARGIELDWVGTRDG